VNEPEAGDDLMTERDVAWDSDVGLDIKRVRIEGAASAEILVTIAV
jgi:hypothetical protein